jgi:hypothetical protein
MRYRQATMEMSGVTGTNGTEWPVPVGLRHPQHDDAY